VQQRGAGQAGQPAEANRAGEERNEPDRDEDGNDAPGNAEETLAAPAVGREDRLRGRISGRSNKRNRSFALDRRHMGLFPQNRGR